MATNYPTALDSTASTLPDNKADSTPTAADHAGLHNNISDAIIAIETALGTTPAGSYATVAAALLNKVDKSPSANQVIQPTADAVALISKAGSGSFVSNLFEARSFANAVLAFIDKNGGFSAQTLSVAGTLLASTHLSDSALLARLASPAFTGTPTAPTATGGDNSTKLATTAFVTTALSGISTTAITSGTLASRPAASGKTGLFYFATDQAVLFFSDGSNWNRLTVPAGTLIDWMQPSSVVPTGWVAYDGSVLSGSTGIYADLYAHLGNTTTLPDTRGRVTVAKGSHTDVLTIGNNDGLAVANRRPKHKHAIVDPGHLHTAPSGAQAFDATPSSGSIGTGSGDRQLLTLAGTNTATTGITVGPQTGAEPTDSPAYITTLKIAKL